MKTLLIVYHSQSGSCAKLARAAWHGAIREKTVITRVKRVWDAATEDIAMADGLLLVAAENSGALSGAMKDFLDRTFYPAIEKGLVCPYALVISAGNDGRGAVQQAQCILSGYPFPQVAEPLVFRGEVTREYLQESEQLGQAFAAGLEMGIY